MSDRVPEHNFYRRLKRVISLDFLYPLTKKDSRVVFNIKRNSYRLIVKFNYDRQWAFIRFVGTHAEYDKVGADII